MRAMAIMYMGPLRNPDFATDYYISPVLAPSELLAKFPPLLMQCGEKDPFVDDTIVFAGRVREAKRQRLAELDKQLSRASPFGEGLRMTKEDSDEEKLIFLRREREKLGKETEVDWVEMYIFSDWSHGYLQMPMLMSEAKEVINDLADWMDDRFATLEGSGTGAIPSAFADSHSNLSSESDDEMADVPVTFSSKRRSSSGTAAAGPKVALSSGEGLPHVNKAAETDGPESTPSLASRQSHQSSGGTGNSSGKTKGRLTGQTITESEVMRRRRLLDSHVFGEK